MQNNNIRYPQPHSIQTNPDFNEVLTQREIEREHRREKYSARTQLISSEEQKHIYRRRALRQSRS